MLKSEVYSWRLSPSLKSALEESARREHATVSQLLEQIVEAWLAERRSNGSDAEEAEQARLHQAAARTFGTIQGGDPDRSENVRQTLRTKLAQRYER